MKIHTFANQNTSVLLETLLLTIKVKCTAQKANSYFLFNSTLLGKATCPLSKGTGTVAGARRYNIRGWCLSLAS